MARFLAFLLVLTLYKGVAVKGNTADSISPSEASLFQVASTETPSTETASSLIASAQTASASITLAQTALTEITPNQAELSQITPSPTTPNADATSNKPEKPSPSFTITTTYDSTETVEPPVQSVSDVNATTTSASNNGTTVPDDESGSNSTTDSTALEQTTNQGSVFCFYSPVFLVTAIMRLFL